ncbi:MAG: T9SS type A sorting domain-containing protein, partial [Crocinitomicaceae bacterium]|nr:T9SS type A sorting domain-containing protein [Crocinitomicaceae bacterium]
VIDGAGNISVCSATVTVTGPILDLTTSLSGATITANATGVTYQWIDCSDNSEIAGETSNQYTASANGDYAVIITNGCSDTSQCVNINTIGLTEAGLDIGFNVFPNPSKGTIIVSTKEFTSGTIQVTDVKGNVVANQELSGLDTMVNLNNVANGVYHIELHTSTGVYRKRIVKK